MASEGVASIIIERRKRTSLYSGPFGNIKKSGGCE